MAADAAPVVITQNEFMRRMKEMAAISGGGMSQFYSQMPDNFTIAVNGNNPIVIDILADVEKSYGDKLKTITKKIDAAVAEERRFDEVVKGKKEEELTPEEKSTREELSKKIVTLRDERDTRLREIGGENKLVKQIIDLALLSNGLLKGKNLTEFIQRSISLIENSSKLPYIEAAAPKRSRRYFISDKIVRNSHPDSSIDENPKYLPLGKNRYDQPAIRKKQRELQVFFQQLHKSFRSPTGTPRIAVDETQNRRTRIEQLARFVVNFVFERNTRFRQLPEGNSNRDQFVVMSRTQVLGVYLENRHHHAVLLLHIGIRRAETAEQLRTGRFVIADVIRMVYDTHLIGILIPDSEFEISCQHGVKTRLVYGPTAFFPPSQ